MEPAGQRATADSAAAEQDPLLLGHPRYAKVRDLGGGAYGQVVLALDKITGQHVALKFVRRGPQHINKYVEREIVNQLKLRHPHVIGLHEVFLTTTHLVLAMEYAEGGDLFKLVRGRRGLTEDEARWFFQQIVIALAYCHAMGVSNRDVKLENTLLDGNPWPAVKLGDFGLSKDNDVHSAPTSRVGTPAYLAPEVITSRPGQAYDAQKADVWSLGILLFAMVANKYPFRRVGDDLLAQSEVLRLMLQRILQADYEFPDNCSLSTGLRDLIRRILVANPEQRLSLQDIQSHPWFLQDLHPDALKFNDDMVRESQANLPSPEMLAEVRAIVQEAAAGPEHAGSAAAPPSQHSYPMQGRLGGSTMAAMEIMQDSPLPSTK